MKGFTSFLMVTLVMMIPFVGKAIDDKSLVLYFSFEEGKALNKVLEKCFML